METLNEWFGDPRVKSAEATVFAAERAEKHGDRDAASRCYLEAARAYASVAVSVPSEYPNTRGAIAISGVVCFALGGDFRAAVDLGLRMLSQPGALNERDRAEIRSLVDEYRPLRVAADSRHRIVVSAARDEVRRAFLFHEAA